MTNPRTVLVTGGAGYIGSHACKALRQAGIRPVTYDNLVTGHAGAVRWGPFVQGALADTDLLARTLAEHAVDAVIHFAAHAYVGESVTQPLKYYDNNVLGTTSLLQAMVRAGVNKIVFSSTCASYGVPENVPIDESHPQRPINPYGRTKRIVEQMLAECAAAHGLRHMSLRYFNAAGADADGEIGEEHEPETHLIPRAIDAALGQDTLEVYGDDYPTPDGTCIRDYIHVEDLAHAHLRALTSLDDPGAPAAVNLGIGCGFSVREVLAAVEKVSGKTVPFTMAPRRPGDPPVLVADNRLARDVLGWEPRYRDIESIVETAHRYRVNAKRES